MLVELDRMDGMDHTHKTVKTSRAHAVFLIIISSTLECNRFLSPFCNIDFKDVQMERLNSFTGRESLFDRNVHFHWDAFSLLEAIG